MSSGQSQDKSDDMETVFNEFTEIAGQKGKLLQEDAQRWLEDANIIGSHLGMTVSDFKSVFEKKCKEKTGMDYNEFKPFVESLAQEKKQEASNFMKRLVEAAQENKEEKK
ncbi:hypothetical protein TNCT_716591 [Trichonephila clavata]|uniref:Uncharacterized protein n=1 Tax=Trichonephila clavata TaxID=2740835 RepID=A0A8X6LPQ0_TRICU|nr:hypothetical protein TNCT_716591 [Trichonephila clavata]